jgi:hypothetical protein
MPEPKRGLNRQGGAEGAKNHMTDEEALIPALGARGAVAK